MSRARARQDQGSPCSRPHPVTPMGGPYLPSPTLPIWTPHPSTHTWQESPKSFPVQSPGTVTGTATPTLLQQQAPLAGHPLPPSLSLEWPWVCPWSVSSGQLAVRAAVPCKGEQSLGTGSLVGSRSSPARAPGSVGAQPGARVVLTQDVVLAERAGLLQQEPGIHTVPVELVRAGQHPQPLPAGK